MFVSIVCSFVYLPLLMNSSINLTISVKIRYLVNESWIAELIVCKREIMESIVNIMILYSVTCNRIVVSKEKSKSNLLNE